MFPEKHGDYILAFLNSKVSDSILKIINPTLNYGAGSIANLPIVFPEQGVLEIESSARRCVDLAREDWDSFETSWDFKEHPLISVARSMAKEGEKVSLKKAFEVWEAIADERFQKLKTTEEELNRIFINIYGLCGCSVYSAVRGQGKQYADAQQLYPAVCRTGHADRLSVFHDIPGKMART